MIDLETIPKGWTIAKLDEICNIQTGKWDANHAEVNGKYRFYTCAFEHSYSNTNRFSGECLILPGNGANVGQVFYYNGDFDAYQRTYVIDKIEILPKFLYYHLKLNWKKGTDVKQYGSATNYIRIGNFIDYFVQFPSLNEQKRILTKLEQLLTDLDKGIEYLETTKQQLNVYRQAVIKSAFQGIEEFESLNDIGSWMGGGTPSTQKKEFWNNGNVLWVSSQDVKSKYINDTERKITELAIENSSTKWIKKGSLLFVVRSGILRRIFPIAIAQQNLCVNQDIQTLNLNDNYYTEFVYWYLHGNESDIRHKCAKDGTTVESIDVQKLKKYLIPKSNLDTQIKVIHEIESRLSVCEKIEETIESSLQQAEALRLSIIKKAFEGKLVPQDHNDEPAEKFLERMRVLRQAQGKQGKEKPEKKEKVKTSKNKVLVNG